MKFVFSFCMFKVINMRVFKFSGSIIYVNEKYPNYHQKASKIPYLENALAIKR